MTDRPGNDDLAVATDQLCRVYRQRTKRREPRVEVTALAGIDLEVRQGEVHGLLGPNGAGKTSLCKILSTVLLPTSGTARILGFDVVRDVRTVRFLVGIVFGGDRGLYSRLTAEQNLRYWGALYGLPDGAARARVHALLERMGLADRAHHRVGTFSRGMKQRLHLARGLMGDPKMLLLDEPTNGLDPIATREIHTLIQELSADRTILLTTHDMSEAEKLCHRVTLIDRGQVIATESPRTLATWISRYERIDADDVPPGVLDEIRQFDGVGRVVASPTGAVRIETTAVGATSVVLGQLVAAGVTSVRTSLPSLEEVYVYLFASRGLLV